MLSRSRLVALAKQSVKEFSADNCTHLAAGITYYVLFSIFPLLIFITGVSGIILRDAQLQADLVDTILDFVPLDEQGRADVADAVAGLGQGSSGVLGVFGLAVTAWSASSMFGAIRRSVNLAYDLEVHRPFVRQKLVDLGMVAALAPFFLASIALTATIAFARSALADVPVVGTIAEQRIAWTLFGFGISIVISFLAFSVLYWVIPATDVRLADAAIGAAIAAVAFEAAKIAFSYYLRNFSNYDAVFGALGVVAGFLVWVNISANIMLLGAEVTSELPHVRRGAFDYQPKDTRPWSLRIRNMAKSLFVNDD